MASDKWGIPFWYPTKATAGLTGSGHGFFWQQSNNAMDDDGMIRFGKEIDAVKIINESTGEWMFPFTFAYSYSDGMSLSGPTGHHSGGETHGCQGFTYMIHGEDFDSANPKFRFRKETYHVQYDNDPQTGLWSSPFATGPVNGRWKGFGWVRYNRKGGRVYKTTNPDTGNEETVTRDSVVCEAWWNDDPVNHLKDGWKMLKRTEDKGKGISNWGIKATCDGEDYQVGTWSNIQFRFKSSGADFSLHPLKKETNDSPNINSIGKENMSFSDSEARGYGYRNDMPRDIEMKCLFKWNGSGQGKCHFKNISIREIDPTNDFDSTPDNPGTEPPANQPATTSRIKGNFTLMRDVNQAVNSICAATGLSYYYNTLDFSQENKILGDHNVADFVTIATERAVNSISILTGKMPKQLDVNLKKVGAPAGSVGAKIWDSDGNIKYTSSTTFVNADLTGSFALKSFDFTPNVYTMQVGDRIGVEYTGTDDSNYVICGIIRSNVIDSTNSYVSQYDTVDGWRNLSSYDMGFKIWR